MRIYALHEYMRFFVSVSVVSAAVPVVLTAPLAFSKHQRAKNSYTFKKPPMHLNPVLLWLVVLGRKVHWANVA